ncbi:hypothetical protein Gpo141_00014622 [Globisporangium polare]
MKSFAFVAATLVAQTLAFSTDICPASELLKLTGVASEPGLVPCQDATGFTFLPPSGYPSEDQIFLMCNLDDCKATVAKLRSLGLSDCVTDFGNAQLNVLNITDSFKPACAKFGIEI